MIKKNLRYPAVSLFAIAATLSGASTTWAGQQDSCKAARARVATHAANWKDGGSCDLSDEDTAAVRASSYTEALTNFRGVKDELMKNFDKDTSGSLGANLADLRAASADFLKKHPERGEMGSKLKDLNSKIDALTKAIDTMRPNSTTNAVTLRAIDHAMGDLQDTCDDQHDKQDYCPGAGTGVLESLDALFKNEPTTAADPALTAIKDKVHAINDDGTGLGDTASIVVRMRRIYNCRVGDEQAAHDKACTEVADTTPLLAAGAPADPLPALPASVLVISTDPAPAPGTLVWNGKEDSLANAAAVYFGLSPAPKAPADPFQGLREQGWDIPKSGSALAPQ